jgi:subtilase family serine protease
VHIDPDGLVAETREDNNVITEEVEFHPYVPDLVAEGLEAFDRPVQGVPYLVEVWVGDAHDTDLAGAYTVRFYADDQLVCSSDVSGSSATPECLFPGMTAGVHVLEVVVDADDDVAEWDETNNRLRVEHVVAEN